MLNRNIFFATLKSLYNIAMYYLQLIYKSIISSVILVVRTSICLSAVKPEVNKFSQIKGQTILRLRMFGILSAKHFTVSSNAIIYLEF